MGETAVLLFALASSPQGSVLVPSLSIKTDILSSPERSTPWASALKRCALCLVKIWKLRMNGRAGPGFEKDVISVWSELLSVSTNSHIKSTKTPGQFSRQPFSPQHPEFLLLLFLLTHRGERVDAPQYLLV